MVLTHSTMLPIGTLAPEFSLPDTEGCLVTRSELAGSKGLLVMFICNHCPYVVHIASKLAAVTADYIKQGISVVAINSNDIVNFSRDAPEHMKTEKAQRNYQFPYLFDESQEVAKAYSAACTPDFFLFDEKFQLVYRGQFDNARPGNGVEVTGEDLTRAVLGLLAGNPPLDVQKACAGCNIKWRSGNEPAYF
jgi:peroxiredoxin